MKKHISTIIILILWVVCLLTLGLVFFKSYALRLENYIALGFLIIITIAKVANISHIKIWLGIILILGSLNIISFTYQDYIISFGLKFLGLNLPTISIEPLSFILLLILVITDIEGARSVYRKIIPATDDKKLKNTSTVNIYIEKYKNFSITELESIVRKSDSYQEKAIEAAETLLKKKKRII